MNLVPGQSQFTDNKTWIVKMKYFPQGILTPGPTYPITPWLSSCRQSDKCFLPSGVTFMSGSLTGDFHPGQGWGKKWMALWLWGPWPFLGWRHYTGEVESSTPQIVYLMVEVREDQLWKVPYIQTFELQTFNDANTHFINVRCEWECGLPSISCCWWTFICTISYLLSLLYSVTLLAYLLNANLCMPAVVLYYCTFQGTVLQD